jgi:hypothetical protein
MRPQRGAAVVGAFVTSLALAGCCFGGGAPGAPSPPPPVAPIAPVVAPPPTSGIRIAAVVFARSLDADWQPVGGPVTAFRADEHTVWTRVTIAGRPSSGVVTMRWMWRDLRIAEAQVDLGDVNGGLLFSFGQDTFIKGYMTSPQLYIGTGHRLVLLSGTTELGAYPFTVVPPTGARPSRFVTAALYKSDPRQGNPGAPVTAFGPTEIVYVVGRVALGQGSWFNSTFTVGGQPVPALTQEMIGPVGGGDELNFVHLGRPPGVWPPGTHRVTMVLDDRDVATYDFTVGAARP